MSLIINGIDFEKRCEDAKRDLHLQIEWRAQCLGMIKYFNLVPIVQEKPEIIKRWQELIKQAQQPIKDHTPLSDDELRLLIETARKHIEQYLLTYSPPIQFELERLRLPQFFDAST